MFGFCGVGNGAKVFGAGVGSNREASVSDGAGISAHLGISTGLDISKSLGIRAGSTSTTSRHSTGLGLGAHLGISKSLGLGLSAPGLGIIAFTLLCSLANSGDARSTGSSRNIDIQTSRLSRI